MKISQLKSDPRNANQGTVRGRKALESSLKEFGAGRSILIDKHGAVIAGNKTLEQAKLAGHKDVIVVKTDGHQLVAVQRVDLDLKQPKAQALAIADNRVAELDLAWDPEVLRSLSEDVDLTKFWTADELARVMQKADEQEKPVGWDNAAAAAKKWKTKPGQLWTCAEGHRLLCGDSRSAADVKRLMNGELASLVNTDPPYGVSYSTAAGTKLKGDEKRGDDLLKMLREALGLAVKYSRDEAAFYIWHASSSRRDFEAALDAAGLEEKQYITWFKDSFVLGHADYHWQTEPCFYAQKAGQAAAFYGNREQSTVWVLGASAADAAGRKRVAIANGLRVTNGEGDELYVTPRPPKRTKIRLVRLKEGESLELTSGKRSDSWAVGHDETANNGHPTPKPIELGIRAIENSSQEGQIVLDLFLGGGFSAVAAQKSGRVCYGMELDPKFLAVTLEGLERAGAAPKLAA